MEPETNPQIQIDALADELLRLQSLYAQGHPAVSDLEYDRQFDELLRLEKLYPDYRRPWSPTQRIGSDLMADFPEVAHTVPVLSLDKVYTANEISTWLAKYQGLSLRPLVVVLEQKIDGLSIVLYYEKGILVRALTRGNGYVGNDVTANVKTLPTVPLKLAKSIDLAVRGEIFLPKTLFQQVNSQLAEPYANARNLAAGTLRRGKSRESAEIPLQIFCYEAFFTSGASESTELAPQGHLEALARLAELGFPLNPYLEAFSPQGDFDASERGALELLGVRGKSYSELEAEVEHQTANRASVDWDIDGLVVKVDNLALREELGFTAHHPRWAMAYKFESPQGETTVEEIFIQVGRTGRVTPVAKVAPVAVGGSTIRLVTLHNQAYIENLELNVGDLVTISRRGDVIPAVERVVEKRQPGSWKFPQFCPSCGACLRKDGAHAFCPQPDCPDQRRARLSFFVGKDQMDVENLGPETVDVLIELRLVREPADFFTCDYNQLLDKPGFGEKKVALIREGIERARKRPFERVLTSLGIPELGPKLVELLVASGLRSFEAIVEAIDQRPETLLMIAGIGEQTIENLRQSLLKPSLARLIAKLNDAGLACEAEAPTGPESDQFAGTVWCVTGSFENFQPRSLAELEIQKRSGRVVSAVSGATTHLLAGVHAGSKLQKAQAVGAMIVTEAQFTDWLQHGLPNA